VSTAITPSILRSAGIVTRLLAAAIDLLIVLLMMGGVFLGVAAAGFVVSPLSFRWPPPSPSLSILIGVLLAIGYLAVGRATIGRTGRASVLGLRVVSTDRSRLGWARALDPRPGLGHRPLRRDRRAPDRRPRGAGGSDEQGHHHGVRVRRRGGPGRPGDRRARGATPATQLVQRLNTFTPTLAAAATQFVRDKVGQLVASPQIAAAWNQALRIAHQQLVTVLSGDSQAIGVQGGTVYLDLAPFIDAAKQRLSAEGLTAVNLVPEVHPTIALAPADQLVRAQSAYDALDSIATVLPLITLLLLAVGVYLTRIRMRTLVAAGLGVALALVVLAAGLLVARGLLVRAVPVTGAPAAASGFDILVGSLRGSGRVFLVLALVVALGAFLAGSSATAMGARRWRAACWAGSAAGRRRPDHWTRGCGPTCGDCGSGQSRSPRCSSCSSRSRRGPQY
jgi:hypothetical protein